MNDADIEQAQFEEAARHDSQLRKRGICTHGSAQGNAPCVCRHCGKQFESFEALLEERADLLA